MSVRIVALATLLAAISASLGSTLPESLGEYARGSVSPVPVPAGDRSLYEEYGLRATERSAYTNPAGRTMGVEAFRFRDSEGGHSAYLWLRPSGAVTSPLDVYSYRSGVGGRIYAVLAGGVTVVGWKNYVFTFRGAAPDHNALWEMFDRLPEVDPAEPGPDECCRYLETSSERVLLGPVSLAKFAARIPPSVAAFRRGARGRVARFETPSGPIWRIVFEYPDAAAAQQQQQSFRALPGALVRLAGRKVAVIFVPVDSQEAEELLRDVADDDTPERAVVGWEFTDGSMTLDGGIAMVFAGFVLGGLVAVLRRLASWREGIPDRTIALHLGKG